MSNNLSKVLEYLSTYSGEKYKKQEKCKDEAERNWMSSARKAGEEAYHIFIDLANHIAEKTGFEYGRVTQWQNSGTFVSYFWVQLKKPQYSEKNISLSLFAEKASAGVRFRLSVELADEKSDNAEKEHYKRILDIPLKEDLVYITGGNNNGSFEILDERDNTAVKLKNYKKVQVSYILPNDLLDEQATKLLDEKANDLIEYYDMCFEANNVKEAFFSYLGPVDSLSSYVKSYKLVFLKSFFDKRNEQSISHEDMVALFKSFYMERISRGLVADYGVDQIITNIGTSSVKQVLDVIRNNPYKAISSKGFFSEDGASFKIDDELWTSLTAEDKESIIDLLNKKLELYYKQYETEKKTETKEGEEEVSTKGTIEAIKRYIASKGFTYEEGLVENFFLSLKSKPFVILAGTSGTGKTRLVKLFAEAVGATTQNGRYQMVSVRPDWSDSSDLFGHVDLNGKFIPGAIIHFVKKAEIDEANPYFLCLDEMNLARVEYYLSDVLSVIETRDFTSDGKISTDPLISENYYGSDTKAAGKYGTVRLPENLYIIGTVNMDETTFPFSRKVLDRANTIEFSYVDVMPNFDAIGVNGAPQILPNSFMKAEYVHLAQCKDHSADVNDICLDLKEINEKLQAANAHVGYRVRDEIVFYMLNNKKAGLLDTKVAFDNEIMQKILPRIQGSSSAVKEMLCELFKICAGDYEGYQTDSEAIHKKMFDYIDKKDCKYKKSAAKIADMVRRYETDGFTQYWL